MQVDFTISKQLYTEAKFWIPLVGFVISAVKIYNNGRDYFREIKDNHLTHIQAGINDFNIKLDKAFETQTKEIDSSLHNNTNELKELRGDMRQLTTAIVSKLK